MALSFKAAVSSAPKASISVAARPARVAMVCRAEATSRRNALGLFAGVLAAGVAGKASAITIPSQESTGGQQGRGSMPGSSSAATVEGYTMEGTAKRGISPKRKKEVLAQLRKSEGLGK